MKQNGIQEVAVIFFVLCLLFSVPVGFAGTGISLIFLSIQQSIGIGMLSFGAGALYGATFGSRRLVRIVVNSLAEIRQNQ